MSSKWLAILAVIGMFSLGPSDVSFALDCSPKGAKAIAADDFRVLKKDNYFIKVLGVESREVQGQVETIIGVVVKGSTDDFKASVHGELVNAEEVSCYHKSAWDGPIRDVAQYVWWESKGNESTHTFKVIADRKTKQAKIVYVGNQELVIQLK